MSDLNEWIEWARSLWVVWLMLLFLAIVAWVYRPGSRKRFEKDAKIPLEDDRPEPRNK